MPTIAARERYLRLLMTSLVVVRMKSSPTMDVTGRPALWLSLRVFVMRDVMPRRCIRYVDGMGDYNSWSQPPPHPCVHRKDLRAIAIGNNAQEIFNSDLRVISVVRLFTVYVLSICGLAAAPFWKDKLERDKMEGP